MYRKFEILMLSGILHQRCLLIKTYPGSVDGFSTSFCQTVNNIVNKITNKRTTAYFALNSLY